MAAHQPPPIGTPLNQVTLAVSQDEMLLPSGLLLRSGVNAEVATIVAAETGDMIAWPFVTAGFTTTDGTDLAFAAVLSATERNGRSLISFMDEGLGCRREVVVFLCEVVFAEAGAAELVTWVRPHDLARRDALRRLGFRRIGNGYDGRVLYSIVPADFPSSFRAYRARRRH